MYGATGTEKRISLLKEIRFNDLMETGKIKKQPFVKRIAISDIFIIESGSQDYLIKTAGLIIR